MKTKPTWFEQVRPESIENFRKMGAKYAVAVAQRATMHLSGGSGSSEEHVNRVRERIGWTHGLYSFFPGSDWWDNPCICVAVFSDLRDAEECLAQWEGSSQLLDLTHD